MNALTALLIAAVLGASDGMAPVKGPVDFDSIIVPILTKSGCNSGACHGAAVGRGGLALSLFGSDPATDYQSITQDYRGRRIRHDQLERSLFLRKPSADLPHGGDQVLDPESSEYALIREWLEQGAKRELRRRLIDFRIEMKPSESESNCWQLLALAEFDHGPTTDVTSLVQFTIEDAFAVQWQPSTFTVKALHAGRHIIIARYMDRVVPVLIQRGFGGEANQDSFAGSRSKIDETMRKFWQELHLRPTEQVDDARLLRRLSIELHGRLPTPAEVRIYRENTDADKREKWIERSISEPEFADYWTLRMCRWLGVRSLPNETKAVQAYTDWILDGWRNDRSFRDTADQLLIATGDTQQVGPANFARSTSDPRQHAEKIAAFFMGSRLQCANCHNHPLDRWTQDDYHGLAAIFAQVDRDRLVKFNPLGTVTHIRTAEPARPKIPGGTYIEPGVLAIEAFRDWLLDDSNPFLATVMANRIWSQFFNIGIVDAADDFRQTNPPRIPMLLEQLTQDFRSDNLRLKPLIQRMLESRVYSLSASESPDDLRPKWFAAYQPRPLEPEVLLDAVSDVLLGRDTSHPDRNRKAILRYDQSPPFEERDRLSNCSRTANCDGRFQSMGLASQLYWINGNSLNPYLQMDEAVHRKLIREGQSNHNILVECFMRAYSWNPDREELDALEALIPSDDAGRVAWFDDFLWSLLSSSEFLTNH